MGEQSAVTIGSGARGRASATYLTGTLTSLVHALVSRLADGSGGAAGLAALLCGAVVGALLLRVAPLWAPVAPVLLVGVVLVIATRTSRGPR
jgi:hypothetical protein